MKKKILFVIDSLHSGGAEKSLVTLLNLLDYSKYEVDLLMFKQEGLYAPLLPKEINKLKSPIIFKEMEDSLINLLKSKNLSKFLWRISIAINIRYMKSFTKITHGAQRMWPNLNREIEPLKKEYDIAIAYSQGTPTYYVAEKVSSKKKLCWINTDYKLAKYNKNFDLKYYEQFDSMIGVSEKCTEVLRNVFPEFKNKLITIYDIISEEIIQKMTNSKEGFEDEFNGIRILTIGRLVYEKGYEYAIEAAKYLKESKIDFRWYVIGEGELKNELEMLVKNYDLEKNFIFLGTYENPYPFIKQCDIYCQPSRFEGYGLAIAEARILNKPIVTTNFEVVYDQIRHKENGIIVDMNGEAVAQGILRLVNDSHLREDIIAYLRSEKKGNVEELEKFYQLIN